MPELPDVTLYVEAIRARLVGRRLAGVRVAKPFVVRTFDPPVGALRGEVLTSVERLGKRIVLALGGELFAAIHLMIAGRLRYLEPAAGATRRTSSARRASSPLGARGPGPGDGWPPLPGKLALLGLDFDAADAGNAGRATLVLTEAGSERRAALHVVRGRAALAALDAGGVEPLAVDRAGFAAALLRENHTLKRALTDPRLFAGIGNAYSDEILHRARLSPLAWTTRLGADEIERLHDATRHVLRTFTDRMRAELAARSAPGALPAWPDTVTAFRPDMAVHGRYREPCPDCGTRVQRIVRGKHEVDYCPRCQTGGKLLADRALSRLLRGDWPKTLEELDEHMRVRAAPA
ncbi:MAG: formamidopyrimidine-DNA glycosylase [Polyangiaceae bacterium]|nr:formamidopyrimidine-DNA glycosylase [Polyangiaceae bacterium]